MATFSYMFMHELTVTINDFVANKTLKKHADKTHKAILHIFILLIRTILLSSRPLEDTKIYPNNTINHKQVVK